MSSITIRKAQSIEELHQIASSYSSAEEFVKAIEEEFYQSQDEYAAAWKEIAIQKLPAMKRFYYSHWAFFRHLLKLYHLVKHETLADEYYARNGGFNISAFSSETKLLDCADYMTSLRKFAAEFYNNSPFYLEFSDNLADEKSKTVLFHIVKARLTLDIRYYSAVKDTSENQYFDPDIIRFEDEVFCDVGAYIGDTAEILMKKADRQLRHLYLYEPNSENCKAAKAAMDRCSNGYTEITIRKCGVSNINGEAFIDNNTCCSQVNSSEKGEKIALVTLDSDIPEPVSFIKMDIEGLELAALEGSKQHITHDRPKLTICIYHQVEDIRNISQWIRQQVPDYHFYIRHYSDDFNETVLYCLP